MAQTYRLRDEESDMLQEAAIKMIVESKIRVKESDLLHALIRKHLKEMKVVDVLKYREEVLGKSD